MKYVLVCPEKGVFVGTALGLAFWSGIETANQRAVPVCNTEEEARELRMYLKEPETTKITAVDLPNDAIALSSEAIIQHGWPWVE